MWEVHRDQCRRLTFIASLGQWKQWIFSSLISGEHPCAEAHGRGFSVWHGRGGGELCRSAASPLSPRLFPPDRDCLRACLSLPDLVNSSACRPNPNPPAISQARPSPGRRVITLGPVWNRGWGEDRKEGRERGGHGPEQSAYRHHLWPPHTTPPLPHTDNTFLPFSYAANWSRYLCQSLYKRNVMVWRAVQPA